jgi:hypothetical protein
MIEEYKVSLFGRSSKPYLFLQGLDQMIRN